MSRLRKHKTGRVKEEERIKNLKKEQEKEDKFLALLDVPLWYKPYEKR